MSSTESPPGTRRAIVAASCRPGGRRKIALPAAGDPPRTGPLAPDSSRLVACPTVSDVLIATDADWILDDVDAALSDEDTRVLRVRRGRDVSEAVRLVEPALIVLDLQIGNMGGIA